MTRTQWQNLSTQGRIEWLLQYQVVSSFPANRPEIVPVKILVTNTNDVVLSDLLVNYQLFSIVGFTSAGVATNGSAMKAKISSIAGGTFDERNYIGEAALGVPGFATAGLIYSIIESTDIVITLAGGHGLQELHFYCLPATYLVNQPNPQDSNLFN